MGSTMSAAPNGRTPASLSGRSASPTTPQPRFVRFSPSAIPTTTPVTSPGRDATPNRRGADAERENDGRNPDPKQQQQPVEDPPPDRAEDPLPEEQRQPDRKEESRGNRHPDGDPDVDRDPLDLVDHLAELGLRQLDVRANETLYRILRRPELPEEARRILGRNARVGRVIGRGRRRILGGGCGRLRLVQWGGLPASTWGTGR